MDSDDDSTLLGGAANGSKGAAEKYGVDRSMEKAGLGDGLGEGEGGGCCSALAKYPKPIPFIIGNEFCERFTYYGMRAILALFFEHQLMFSKHRSTALFHAFIMISYFTSAFGGMLADSSLGKYRTILYLSIVYCIGCITLSVTSIHGVTGTPPHWWGAALGLFLIAVGTGGIKPCVSSFGGDQFKAHQLYLLPSFFSIFYFSINAGSFISTIITPKLRADVQCFGDEECYPLAFGLPAILMTIATIIFVSGRPFYTRRIPDRNIVLDALKATRMGLRYKMGRLCGAQVADHAHWLDPASKTFGGNFVADLKMVYRVLLIFLPMPVFWALYDQQGSRWTFQAEQMKTFTMGAIGQFRPDQMQAVNSVLILALIPVFEKGVYPALTKLRVSPTPLQRMGAGMVLCALSFVISALIQLRIDNANHVPVAPADQALVQFVNAYPSEVDFSAFNATVAPQMGSSYQTLPPGLTDIQAVAMGGLTNTTTATLAAGTVYSVFAYVYGGGLGLMAVEDHYERLEDESAELARIRFANFLPDGVGVQVVVDDVEVAVGAFEVTRFADASIESGRHYVRALNADGDEIFNRTVTVDDGAQYTLFMSEREPFLFEDVLGNEVSIAWQLPQYFVVTCGEILFSITGLEFAYAEAPETMKAVVQSAWLLTTSAGSLIVVIVAESSLFEKQWHEFLFFAALLIFVVFIHIYLAMRYTYRRNVDHELATPEDSAALILSQEDGPTDSTV